MNSSCSFTMESNCWTLLMSYSKFVLVLLATNTDSILFRINPIPNHQYQPHLSHLYQPHLSHLYQPHLRHQSQPHLATGTSLISATCISLILDTSTSLISTTMPGPRGRSRISEKGGGGGGGGVLHMKTGVLSTLGRFNQCVCVWGGGGCCPF